MFAILENGSVETMLRYRLRFSTGRAFAIPTGQSKTRMTVMTLRSCARTFIAGPTMSIIESLLVLWRLAARAKQSAPSGGNGRRVISVDRPLRLRTAPRERPGCSPASLPPEGTSWPFSRCIGPDGPPVGGVQQPPPTMVLEENVRVSGISLPAQRGGKARQRTLPEEPLLLHRSSTGPDVQQVAFRRLVTPLHRKGVDELLETGRELTVLTEDQRRDAADLLEPPLERPVFCLYYLVHTYSELAS